MSSYQKRIVENFNHMGTDGSKWHSVPILDLSPATDAKGKTVYMPVFDFPKGYAQAPTLFPSPKTAPYCCELCGKTPINVLYHIQNDEAKQTMAVGSECVTHFQDESGEDQLKSFKLEAAAKLDAELVAMAKYIRDNFSRMTDAGYGRRLRKWDSCNLSYDGGTDYWDRILKGVTELKPVHVFDKKSRDRGTLYWAYVYKNLPLSGSRDDAGLLSWFTRKGELARAMLNEIKTIIDLIK